MALLSKAEERRADYMRSTVHACPMCGSASIWSEPVCAKCADAHVLPEDTRNEPDAYRKALRRSAQRIG